MAIELDEFLAKLPPERRAAIQAEAARLIEQEATLRELRRARRRSQAQVGKKLGVNQAAVSKIEGRADMYVSTLRRYIKAVGGELEIVARFPNKPPVRITQFRRLKGKVLA